VFTGLVREIGIVRSLLRRGDITRIVLQAPRCVSALQPGASLAVNGICLTVTRLSGPTVSVEAAAETRRVTTLQQWRTGQRVHLEPALRAGDSLGGHLVLGHVDGRGTVARIRREQRSLVLTVKLPAPLARLLLSKGSVAVDGVSLTVDSGPFDDRFTVNVIPYTLADTNLGRLRVGQTVNLEMDVLVKAARGVDLGEALQGVPGGETTTGRRTSRPWTLERLLARGYDKRSPRDR